VRGSCTDSRLVCPGAPLLARSGAPPEPSAASRALADGAM